MRKSYSYADLVVGQKIELCIMKFVMINAVTLSGIVACEVDEFSRNVKMIRFLSSDTDTVAYVLIEPGQILNQATEMNNFTITGG